MLITPRFDFAFDTPFDATPLAIRYHTTLFAMRYAG